MKVWDRYAEYAIIGGLFWISMFIAATIVKTGDGNTISFWKSWIENFSAILPDSGSGAFSVITSLLSALGVIAVFCTGMLIDIISPYFFILFEILYFKRYFLEKNCSYIEKVFKGDKSSSMYTDYVLFNTSPTFKNFAQWQSQRRRYTKLLTLLTSYCLKNSESGMLEDLKDRLILWKTGRALGGSIFLLALTINLLLVIPKLEFDKTLIGLLSIFGIGFLIIMLGILSILFAIGPYLRMCNTLKSVIYLIDDKDTPVK